MKNEPNVQQLLARLDAGEFAVMDPREAYASAEIGLTFDGRMVYDRALLVSCFMEMNGWGEDEANEWIDYNVVPADAVAIAG